MPPTATNRVDALDAAKGVLVVFMVIYHSLNYSTQYHLAFRYLAFLPPSFILITGFLLCRVYLERHKATDLRMHARILTRGLKLVALFTVLNVGAQLVHSRHYHNPTRGLGYFVDHWPDVYFHGDTRLAVFEVLLPIAYLLLLSPLLLLVAAWHRCALPILASALIITCLTLDVQGLSSQNLNLIVAGVAGMWLGRLSFVQLNQLGRWWWLSLAGYAVYAAAGLHWGQPFLLQLTGAVLALAAIYGGCLHLDGQRAVKPWLLRLGRYSLFSYVAQIAILQVLSHVAGRPEPLSPGFPALVFGTLALTTLLVELVAWSRARLRVVNGAYEAVFA